MLRSLGIRVRDTAAFTKCRLAEILRDYDHEWQELISALALLVWGGSLLIPGLNQFDSLPYTAMRQLCPQWVWSVILMVVGSLKLHGLMTEHTTLRRRTAFVGSLIWMFTSIMVAQADPRFPTVVIAPILAASAAASYLRLCRRKG